MLEEEINQKLKAMVSSGPDSVKYRQSNRRFLKLLDFDIKMVMNGSFLNRQSRILPLPLSPFAITAFFMLRRKTEKSRNRPCLTNLILFRAADLFPIFKIAKAQDPPGDFTSVPDGNVRSSDARYLTDLHSPEVLPDSSIGPRQFPPPAA